ncbi:MAG: tryptophan 7-halogenase [Acidobacteriota bacterium]
MGTIRPGDAGVNRERPFALIIGAGFAGSLMARVLARLGKSALLVDKSRHPRFALGESTTPLANLSLERLAARYRLEDLHDLAAYGRWMSRMPELRRGLKRGFTFYHHTAGQPYDNGPDNDRRLLVSASPNARIADTHWLRSDLDAFLIARASEEGVQVRQETLVSDVTIDAENGVSARLLGPRGEESVEAEIVIDAGGGGGVLATSLGLRSRLDRVSLDTSLIYTHTDGLRPLREVTPLANHDHSPYPDERAAVHHLLGSVGWLYVLRFDHGPASVGLVLRNDRLPMPREQIEAWPEAALDRLLEPYPSLHETFESAEPVRPVRFIPRLQHRLEQAAGPRWFLLPSAYAFFDPMFSTGIAWNLLAVERLASIFEGRYGDAGTYSSLLHKEADQVESLIDSAYRALDDGGDGGGGFDRFVAVSCLYFAAASYAETRQRLMPARASRPDAWSGLLGADDPVLGSLVRQTRDRLGQASRRLSLRWRNPDIASWLLSRLSSRDIMGLDAPARPRLYPVDLEILEQRCDRLGLTPEEIFAALPRLRGEAGL